MNTSAASCHLAGGALDYSAPAGHAPVAPPSAPDEYFTRLGTQFIRWAEMTPAEQEEIRRRFVEEFLPQMPEELLEAAEQFFENESDE